MIQYEDFNINVDTDEIILLLAKWDEEFLMDAESTFHMRESYILKSQNNDSNPPTYMEDLSGKHLDIYYKAMYNEIYSLIGRYTREIASRRSFADHNLHPVTWSFKFNIKTDWTILKFKEHFF